MFNMEKIGEIIAEKRKEKNMTQGQFAEKLSITHQAVSKWERGEAMPEISKLMEVAKILEISLDEILSPDITSSSLDYELNNQENNVLKEQKYLNKYDEKYYLNKENISFGDFYEIASKLSQEALLDGAKKFKREYGLYGIRNLFKFMENKTADQIALESFGINSYNDLKLIFKYLSEDVLNSIVKKIYINVGISGIVEAAPFIKQEIIEKLAFESFCISGIKVIVPIAKFISPKLLQEMAFDEVESVGTWNTIDAIIPILPSENVFNLAYKFYKDHELASFNGRWNLIGRVNTARLVAEYVKDNKYIKDCWSWCDYILPFCQQEVLEQAIIKGYEVNGIDSIKSVIKYLSSKTKKIILKENGIKNKEETISTSVRKKIIKDVMPIIEKLSQRTFDSGFWQDYNDDFDIDCDITVEGLEDVLTAVETGDKEEIIAAQKFIEKMETLIEEIEEKQEELEVLQQQLEVINDEIYDKKAGLEKLVKEIKIQKDNYCCLKESENPTNDELKEYVDVILNLQQQLKTEKEEFDDLINQYSLKKQEIEFEGEEYDSLVYEYDQYKKIKNI